MFTVYLKILDTFCVPLCAVVVLFKSMFPFPSNAPLFLAPVDPHLSYAVAQQKRMHVLRDKLYVKIRLQTSWIKIHPHWCIANWLSNYVRIVSRITDLSKLSCMYDELISLNYLSCNMGLAGLSLCNSIGRLVWEYVYMLSSSHQIGRLDH